MTGAAVKRETISLQQSYAYCRQVARSRAKNFYYSFLLLDKPRREAMCAVYAFMRYCDDLSDETGSTTPAIMEAWRKDLSAALRGEYGDHPVWPAFHDTVQRYRIPERYFHEMIDGVSSDLAPKPIDTFSELYGYCYRVASVVGLTIIHIFGFHSPKALELAEKCGIAFQLTNILRDVQEDSQLGRQYLPTEDLHRFGVRPDQLEYGDAFFSLMRFETGRAKAYYEEAMPLIQMVSKSTRPSLWALIQIYYRLLQRIEARGYRVLDERVRLSSAEKMWLLVEAGARRVVGAL